METNERLGWRQTSDSDGDKRATRMETRTCVSPLSLPLESLSTSLARALSLTPSLPPSRPHSRPGERARGRRVQGCGPRASDSGLSLPCSQRGFEPARAHTHKHTCTLRVCVTRTGVRRLAVRPLGCCPGAPSPLAHTHHGLRAPEGRLG